MLIPPVSIQSIKAQSGALKSWYPPPSKLRLLLRPDNHVKEQAKAKVITPLGPASHLS